MKYRLLVYLFVGGLLLSACNTSPNSQPAAITMPTAIVPTATLETAVTSTIAPTNTPLPTESAVTPETAVTSTSIPTNTPPPPTTSTQTPPPNYLDDRSSAAALMQSYVNALNLHQYLRAYSYWNPDAAQLTSFSQFEAGYTDTQSVQLTLGEITGDAGAGQLYYAVPVTLLAQLQDSTMQTFVGCYVLHLSQPAIQGEPPFRPLSIDSALVDQVGNGVDTAVLMSQACQDYAGSPLPATPVPDPNDISADRYLDDRTNAAQVIRSLFNAVNRHEYVRAYSYWRADAEGLQPFDQFQQGYEDTTAVQLTLGETTTDAGAGQRYYQIPTTLVATKTDSTTETFVVCYTLHLGLPDAQGVPPYQPITIISAAVQQVANDADTTALMAQACQ